MMGLIPHAWVTILAITVAMSFVVSALLNHEAHGIYARFTKQLNYFQRYTSKDGHQRIHSDVEPISLGTADIVIFGMGRLGTSTYDRLKQRGENVIGLDSDQEKVHDHQQRGRWVLYADAENSDLWDTLDISDLCAILLAMPDMEAKEIATKAICHNGYKGLLGATNLFPEEEEKLLELGCNITYNYYSQAGIGFADKMWSVLHREGEAQPRQSDSRQ